MKLRLLMLFFARALVAMRLPRLQACVANIPEASPLPVYCSPGYAEQVGGCRQIDAGGSPGADWHAPDASHGGWA